MLASVTGAASDDPTGPLGPYPPLGPYSFDDPLLTALHAGTDLMIGLSYVAISFTLVYFVYRARRSLPFEWMFLAFGGFIVACGATHFMHVVTIWTPAGYYWLGAAQVITTVASVLTAGLLPPLVPKALALVEAARLSEERRVQLEQTNSQLARLYERLKELDELKTQFFANVSHELRTPLTLIIGPAKKLLGAPELREDQRRDVGVIERNARALLKHVNDLLEVSKLEVGKSALSYAAVDLARLVRLVGAHFEALAEERQIDFAVEAPAVLTAAVDPERVQRVVTNLLANAFKFTPAGGRIRCLVRAEGERAVIDVQDNGPGVRPEQRAAIFERFRQGDGGATRRFGGTGLGLAIAKEAVELHGGAIGVGEATGGGAVFTVELPLAAPDGVEVRAAAADPSVPDDALGQLVAELRPHTNGRGAPSVDGAAPAPDRARPLVLVVEDNPDMNEFVVSTLMAAYRVASASDGREGLEQAITLRPDLIVSDVMMPRLSGDQLVRAVRERSELDGVPVMLLTAKTDDELRVRLLAEGAQEYLHKPFAAEELLARAGNLIAMKRAREALQAELHSQSQDVALLASELGNQKRDLARLNEELAAAVRSRDEFLSIAAHELKTPLTSLRGFAQVLTRQYERTGAIDPERLEHGLRTIDEQSERISRLVTQLLDVSRLELGQLTIELKPTDLAAVVTAVAARARLTATNHEVIVRAPSSAPILADALRLEQVVTNLVDNAIKYSPDGGPVDVELSQPTADGVRLTVTDHGLGIPPEKRERIFERYYQAHGDSHRSGLGLGLHISRQIVELHGGEIRAEFPEEGGTRFVVALPVGSWAGIAGRRDSGIAG